MWPEPLDTGTAVGTGFRADRSTSKRPTTTYDFPDGFDFGMPEFLLSGSIMSRKGNPLK